MREMSFDYYYDEQSESFRFLRVPRLLFTAPQFRGLSTDAKLLYSLMLDRMCLSARNGWYDEQGRVFIYYTVTDIAEHLNCKKDKTLKLLNELDNKKGVGLIERIRQGQGKPSKIYVRQFTAQGHPEPPHHPTGSRNQNCTETEVLTAQNDTSAPRKTGSQEYGKTECNYTNKNYTELMKSIHLSIHPETDLQRDSQLSGQPNPVTQQAATPRGVAVRASMAFVSQTPLVRGMPLKPHPQQQGVTPCAEGIPPSVRRQGRAFAAQPPASSPFDGAGLDCGPPAGLEAAKGITPSQGAAMRALRLFWETTESLRPKRRQKEISPKLGLIKSRESRGIQYPLH